MKTNTSSALPSVTIIGLGAMGSTLARLSLKQGLKTTVWNRTTSKAQVLRSEGALIARTVAEAVAASDLIIINVNDIASGQALLHSTEVTSVLKGRIIIHLSTGNATDSRHAQAWANQHGATLLAGAIQAAPAQMGRADTTLLISGDKAGWEIAESVLRIYGGNLVYLGEDAGAGPTMDLATLSYVYGSVLGFIHGARISEVAGIDLVDYGRVIADIAPSFGEFLRFEAETIKSGDFSIKESPLEISINATERLVQTAREAGLNDEFPTLVASLFKRAGNAGYAREEAAALIKVLR